MNRFHFHFWGDVGLTEEEFFSGELPIHINNDAILGELEGFSPVELLVDWGLDRDIRVSVEDTHTGAIYDEDRGQWVKR